MTILQDAAPVAISGPVGSTVSLSDLLRQTYGDNASLIQSVRIQCENPAVQTSGGSNWEQGGQPAVTTVLKNGVSIGVGNFISVDKADFGNVQVQIGNNMTTNVSVQVTETSDANFTGHQLYFTALPKELSLNLPADHVPTATDIVSAAEKVAANETHVNAPVDCHNIATAIAASAGATLDPNTHYTGDPGQPQNEAGGFWRIAFTNGSAGNDWQSKVQAGDIVRMERTDGGVHTVTVTAGLNADGKHPGQIEVVDNSNGVITEHWQNYNDGSAHNTTIANSVTVYRLTTDGMYLIDQSSDTHNDNVLGDNFSDLIKAGSGNDTLTGGAGNDTLDGGAGDNTAVFSGKESDYKITVNGGTATIADLRAGSHDGTDTITNIQHVKFSDMTVNYSDLKTTPVAPPPAAGSVSINNFSITEGNNGTQIETFTVTRTGGNAAFDVNYATADGTATTADKDYVGQSNVLHFAQGDLSKTISVVVNSDTKVEANETFNVNLSGATNGATISHAQGVGTIVNDDVAPAPAAHHVANDFNGDGISDVLLGNSKGSLALWELNGDHIASNTTVGSVAAGWHVDSIGDFGGDGMSDILLHSDNGQVAMWQMNGDHIASNTTVGSVSADWHEAGIGDFNGDGKADIMWENSKGQVAMWEMNGDHIASNTTVGSVSTDWHVAGTGDFNGDGKADIMWENSKGQVAMWEMNGNHIASNTTVGAVSTDWHVAGTGDFNGDSKTDIIWGNVNGQVAMWQMNGDHINSNTSVGSAPGWTVIGTGDYNHDGKADILLQNANGSVAEWQMNGDHIVDNHGVGSHSVDWHMV